MSQERYRLLLTAAAYWHSKRKERNAHTVTKNNNRRWWVHPIISRRSEEGAWSQMIEEFRTLYPEKHRQFFRVTPESFEYILAQIKHVITKQDTQMRKAIDPGQRLAVTLMYLATGDSFKTLSLFFRIGESTLRGIVYETCKAIWDVMKDKYLKTPSSAAEWLQISTSFEEMWQFPHCLGAIDGKHCAIQAPPNSGSQYFNYKKHFSIVLMAISDPTYCFTYVDVGAAGRWSDGGTFDHCSFNTAASRNELNLPADDYLPGETYYHY